MITKTQIKCIYALSRKIDGLDNETLHALVYKLVGGEHISKLTDLQATKVVNELIRLQNKVTKNGKLSDGQKKMMYRLMYNLKWTCENGSLDMKRLNGFVKKYTKVDNYKWLSYRQASNVIEGLKRLL